MRPLIKKLLSHGKHVLFAIVIYGAIFAFYAHFSRNTSERAPYTSEQIMDAHRQNLLRTLDDPANNKLEDGSKIITTLQKMGLCVTVGEACQNKDGTYYDGYQNSLTSLIAKGISMPYANPPASGVYYVYETLQNAGFAPKTYAAQGVGFSKLKPFQNLWTAFRNITYLMVVLIIVTIGFLIMFRVRVNPQTVVTLENSLPRLFVSLILISLSYAIAGFMIDLMYVVMLLGISVIGQADSTTVVVADEQSRFLTARASELFHGLSSANTTGGWGWLNSLIQGYDVGDAIFKVMPGMLNGAIRTISFFSTVVSGFILASQVASGVGKPLTNITILANALGHMPEGLIGSIGKTLVLAIGSVLVFAFGGGIAIMLLVFITLISIFFRIIITLFTSYIKVLYYIMFAPLYLMLGAIPGNNTFTKWVRILAGELSVFPVTVFIILIAKLVHSNIAASNGVLWTPPFVHGIKPEPLGVMVSIGMLFILPDILKFVKVKVSGQQASGFNVGLGTFIGGAAALAGGYGIGKTALGFVGQSNIPWIKSRVEGMRDKPGRIGSLAKTLMPANPLTTSLKELKEAIDGIKKT